MEKKVRALNLTKKKTSEPQEPSISHLRSSHHNSINNNNKDCDLFNLSSRREKIGSFLTEESNHLPFTFPGSCSPIVDQYKLTCEDNGMMGSRSNSTERRATKFEKLRNNFCKLKSGDPAFKDVFFDVDVLQGYTESGDYKKLAEDLMAYILHSANNCQGQFIFGQKQ